MKLDILWNFISPVTGRTLSTTDYVLIGDRAGIATPSPILIDIRLDLINLRQDYNLATSADYVIGSPNIQLPNAQVLNTMPNGYVYNTAGIVSTIATIPIGGLPNLEVGNIWIGDSSNRPVANPTIALNNLPNLPNIMTYVGDTFNRPQISSAVGPQGPKGYRGPPGLPGENGSSIQGIAGIAGIAGILGLAGLAGLAGLRGAAGTDLIIATMLINTNLDMSGNRIENLYQSPQGDFDAITAKWAWDLIESGVIFKF
jgi:hypothetical protein